MDDLEWEPFKVNEEIPYGCVPFDTISHVAHQHVARQIMRDGCIKSGLIFDECKLNNDRILVTWLSPNDWHPAGFRYGNVRYTYNFASLIEGKRYYWVESRAYGIEACRILVTRQDRGGLASYDPTLKTGPWWYDTDTGTHYRNGTFTLEFMFEEDLPIDTALLGFVKHHLHQCNISPGFCSDRGTDAIQAGMHFLAFLLADTCDLPAVLFTDSHNGRRFLNTAYWSYYVALREPIVSLPCSGDVRAHSAVGWALARALFSAYANRNRDEVAAIASLFASDEELKETLNEYTLERFGLDDLWYD